MKDIVFFHRLTLERCQYQLAQLCAALLCAHDRAVPGRDETVQALLENLGKDLSILSEFICEESGDAP